MMLYNEDCYMMKEEEVHFPIVSVCTTHHVITSHNTSFFIYNPVTN